MSRFKSRVDLQAVSRPKQARSEETLYRLLDAAEDLISEKGIDDASIPEIVRRARSSVGGFYARFRDKDELLRALEERFYQRVLQSLERAVDPERWSDSSVRDIVRACVAELVAITRARRNLIAAFFSRATRDPAVMETRVRFRRLVSKRVGDLLLARSEQIGHPDPELAIDFGVQFAFGLMLQNVMLGGVWAAGRSLGDRALEREISHIFLAYIGAEPEPSRRRSGCSC